MRVGVPLSPFGEKTPSGLGIFNKQLLLAMAQMHPEWQFTLFLKGDFVDTSDLHYHNIEVVYVARSVWWKDIAYYKYRHRVDVWLFTNPSAPILAWPQRSVMAALDFGIYYEVGTKYLSRQTWLLWCMQYIALRKASIIVSTSLATSADLLKFFPRVQTKKVIQGSCGYTPICAVYEAGESPVTFTLYYLMVGVIKPRKNQLTALRAFLAAKEYGLPGKLVIVGKGNGAYYDELLATIESSLWKEDVMLLGYVTNESLVALYKGAHALVFPSRTEGFGMAIVEAMSCGVPVIASSNSGQGEVANGFALTADAMDVAGFTEAMLLMQDPAVRAKMATLAIERSTHYSWTRAATTYCEAVELLGQK